MKLRDLTTEEAFKREWDYEVMNVEVLENRGQDFKQTLVKVKCATDPEWRRSRLTYLWMDKLCIRVAAESELT
jgi:hypothetical protein